MVRIVAATRVLNEEDIVEPLVRHHAALVDHQVILDNGSSDRTLEILRNLTAEGMALTVLQCPSSIFSETQFNTMLYRHAVETLAADWVAFLDADEFIDARGIADLRSFLAAVPPAHASVGIQLVNYEAPSPATDADINVVRRFSRRTPHPIGVWKVFVRASIGAGRVVVDAGNHHILVDGRASPAMRQHELLLAHYPNRSPYQWIGKAVIGRLKVLAAGQMEVGQGRAGHYAEPFQRLKEDGRSWIQGALDGFERSKTSADLVDDPIDYLGQELIYTQPVDYALRALGFTLTVMERLAEDYGAALDAHARLRAEVHGRLARIATVSTPLPDSTPPAPYGSILTVAWRKVTDAGFAALLGVGWSKPEDWGGIWGVGPVHELRLAYSAVPASHAEVEAVVAAAFPGARQQQQVDIVVEGQRLETWEFTRENNLGQRRFRIPRSLIAAGLPVLSIEFRPRSVASPAALEPDNSDDRLLGMSLHRVRQVMV